MQYAVYLHAWWTQGASVASVYVTRREGKKKEQRKQARVTPDSPSTCQSNYFPSWGTGCRSQWRSLGECRCTWTKSVIFKYVCVSVLHSDTTYFLCSICQHTYSINVWCQKLCNLLWHFSSWSGHIVWQHLFFYSYSTAKHYQLNMTARSVDILCRWNHIFLCNI